MTRPVWKPHQVRDQINTVATSKRVYTQFRNAPPPPPTGPGQGLPTFAALTWHWPTWAGDLTAGVTDTKSVRWQCSIVAAVFDVQTWTNSFTIEVLLNGSPISGLTCVILGAGPGQRFIANPMPVIPYTDGLSLNVTGPGSGNTGIIASLEAI